MANSILEQIFNGDVYPAERIIPKSERYKKVVAKLGERIEALNATLDDEQKKQLLDIHDLILDLIALEEVIFFSEGFKMGLKLGMEVAEK